MTSSIHWNTPTLTVTDPRQLHVASVAYYRGKDGDPVQTRTERQAYDAAGRICARWDARLWALEGESGTPNQRQHLRLSGQVLNLDSVDAGWRVELFGSGGQALERWDGRGAFRQITYDPLMRPLSVHEQLPPAAPRCVERFTYAGSDDSNNCRGRLVRHDDTAGKRQFVHYDVSGRNIVQTQQWLKDLDSPDWPASLTERDALLETGAPFLTQWLHDALGAVLSQVDAAGNEQCFSYDVAGQLAHVDLIPQGEASQVIASDTRYNAAGQIESQTAGNRVISQATYEADSGRLVHLHTARPDKVLQDLHISQDPVGNVLSIEDKAQPTHWFDAQQIDPVNTYQYDSLDQLVQATGRESVLAAIQPGLPELVVPRAGDASRLRNYRQLYTYDAAGNMSTLKHGDAPTRVMKIAAHSNRSLYMADASNPPDLDSSFDLNGNLLCLEGTRGLAWDARNQLQRVTQVTRDSGDDEHVFVYHGDGQRARKISVKQAKAAVHVAQVVYLPGLEIRRDTATGEVLHVISVQTGRCRMRRLQWQENARRALPPAQSRFDVDDHLGSCALELDEHGEVITHEGYYPTGGSAWWAAKSQTHATGKTIRYSGRERDPTGLYCFGARYYAPWLNRWINPDPAGDIDGLNLYRMVRNNPLRFRDADGRKPDEFLEFIHDYPGADEPGYPMDSRPFRRRDLNIVDAQARLQVVDNEFTHRREGQHTVYSEYKEESGTYRFENEFLPGRWRLMENYRAPNTKAHATDVTFEQYQIISTANNFNGVLPKIIVRWDIKDEYVASLEKGGSEGMLERFLTSKNNGRSTQRILDAFGLQATGIKIVASRDTQREVDVNSIAISVAPSRRKSIETLTRETERDLRRMGRHPVSRVAHSAWRSVKRAFLPTPAQRSPR